MPFPISLAPMMDWTDRYYRYFLRLISKEIRLYTEMITTQAILRGDRAFLLEYDPIEHPVILQLGGSESDQLAECAYIGELEGYDEINLNVGCPSPRVQTGRFGACLMLEPQHVAACIDAMSTRVKIPVTIKCRIGVDDEDSEEALHHFVDVTHQAGCHTYIIHARKALLKGLSPKQNREIPPLRYDIVKRLKARYPHLAIILNGGINDISAIASHLAYADGVMIGRKAYHDPYFLAECQRTFGQDKHILTRFQVMQQYLPYIDRQLSRGIRLSAISRHILGLYHHQPGAAKWRRYLSENVRETSGIEVIEKALLVVSRVC